jgi:hypothetical protein
MLAPCSIEARVCDSVFIVFAYTDSSPVFWAFSIHRKQSYLSQNRGLKSASHSIGLKAKVYSGKAVQRFPFSCACHAAQPLLKQYLSSITGCFDRRRKNSPIRKIKQSSTSPDCAHHCIRRHYNCDRLRFARIELARTAAVSRGEVLAQVCNNNAPTFQKRRRIDSIPE